MQLLKNDALQVAPGTKRSPAVMLNASTLSFEPAALIVSDQPICIPLWQQVEITNAGSKALEIEAVTSDHRMLFPSIPKSVALKPRESTKMQVLLLAQATGNIEGLLFVQTNLGMVPYTVKASAIDNPYKVEPILGAKVLVGERFSPPLSLHNPSDSNLHVREVFTTEGFLHLALPDRPGETTGQSIERPGGKNVAATDKENSPTSAGIWTVLPKQTKTVIHVSFMSHITGKFQGYVHLKTDVDNLLVPVEITVTKGGVHVTPELLDFQTLVSPQQSRWMWLTLTNLNPQPIELLSLYDPKQDPNLQITGFDQKGIHLSPGASVRFAKVTYFGGEEGHMHGKLQLIINDTDSVSATLDIPYKARVLYGSLGFMNDKTKFQSIPGKVTSTVRSIMISNNFSVPILIHAAKIEDPSFQITHFTPNSLLLPGDAASLMRVEFTSNGTSALYTRDLELLTNVTAMKIPLQVYHGRLHCQVEYGDLKECASSNLDLDMGTISVAESRRKHINITNLNPVNVTIESIAFTHMTVNLYMEGVFDPRGEQVRAARAVPRNLQSKRILTLPPGHRLALATEVMAMEAGVTSAAIAISTRRKETILLPVHYESVLGSLAFLPATIRFEASFPGRVQTRTVAARSTFERPLHIRKVRSTDSRIIPELITRSLSPLARTEIARIHYDPSKAASPDESYMPLGDELEWDAPLTEEVVERWTRRQRTWDSIGIKGQTEIEATLIVDTNIIRGASLSIRAFLTKPGVVRESTLGFDLTQVGASVSQMLEVHNPSDQVLAVQLVFPLCDTIAEVNSTCDAGFKLAPEAQQVFYVKPHADLPVGPIIFEPQQHTQYKTNLYVRNNLTMLHPVQLTGVGGSGRLVFPNSTLDFNLTALDLVEELSEEGSMTRQRIAISKSFAATNDCELPVEVSSMDINGIPGCYGFGFQIHDCKPFTVAPHETVSLLVSFTPDFPASRWEQRLQLHTQSGVLAVPLRAFVPPELLPQLADRAPFLGESEASVKKCITIISLALCAVMFIVVVGDSMKVYKASSGGGNGSMQDNLRAGDMISLLSWPSVNALAPTASWASRSGRRTREEHMNATMGHAQYAQQQAAAQYAAAHQHAAQQHAAAAAAAAHQHQQHSAQQHVAAQQHAVQQASQHAAQQAAAQYAQYAAQQVQAVQVAAQAAAQMQVQAQLAAQQRAEAAAEAAAVAAEARAQAAVAQAAQAAQAMQAAHAQAQAQAQAHAHAQGHAAAQQTSREQTSRSSRGNAVAAGGAAASSQSAASSSSAAAGHAVVAAAGVGASGGSGGKGHPMVAGSASSKGGAEQEHPMQGRASTGGGGGGSHSGGAAGTAASSSSPRAPSGIGTSGATGAGGGSGSVSGVGGGAGASHSHGHAEPPSKSSSSMPRPKEDPRALASEDSTAAERRHSGGGAEADDAHDKRGSRDEDRRKADETTERPSKSGGASEDSQRRQSDRGSSRNEASGSSFPLIGLPPPPAKTDATKGKKRGEKKQEDRDGGAKGSSAQAAASGGGGGSGGASGGGAAGGGTSGGAGGATSGGHRRNEPQASTPQSETRAQRASREEREKATREERGPQKEERDRQSRKDRQSGASLREEGGGRTSREAAATESSAGTGGGRTRGGEDRDTPSGGGGGGGAGASGGSGGKGAAREKRTSGGGTGGDGGGGASGGKTSAGGNSGEASHGVDKRGGAADGGSAGPGGSSGATTSGGKRKDATAAARRKEAAAPPKAHRNSGGSSTGGGGGGGGPLQGSVWADPKPAPAASAQPQPWESGASTPRTSSGASSPPVGLVPPDLLAAAGGLATGSLAAADAAALGTLAAAAAAAGATGPGGPRAPGRMPPPPSMPPPPAPKEPVTKEGQKSEGTGERTPSSASARVAEASNPPQHTHHEAFTSGVALAKQFMPKQPMFDGQMAAAAAARAMRQELAGPHHRQQHGTPLSAGHHAAAAAQLAQLHMQHLQPTPLPMAHAAMPGVAASGELQEPTMPRGPLGLDRGVAPLMAPIGPASAAKLQRPATSLLPDQEFIPINTDSPSMDHGHYQVFSDAPHFATSLFSSPFANMFGPVTSYGGEAAGMSSGSGLLADLHADSHPVENATGRTRD